MSSRLIVAPGERFNRLTLLREIDSGFTPRGQKFRRAEFQCQCGNIIETKLTCVVSGTTRSCGCLQREKITELGRRNLQHGETNTPLHTRWTIILKRCSEYAGKGKKEVYFDKGITVCDEWEKYENFRDWALANGYRQDLTIDRKDNNKGYNPDNCRWVDSEIQAKNRSSSYIWHIKGLVFDCGREAGDHFGVSAVTICNWAKRRTDCWKIKRYS